MPELAAKLETEHESRPTRRHSLRFLCNAELIIGIADGLGPRARASSRHGGCGSTGVSREGAFSPIDRCSSTSGGDHEDDPPVA